MQATSPQPSSVMPSQSSSDPLQISGRTMHMGGQSSSILPSQSLSFSSPHSSAVGFEQAGGGQPSSTTPSQSLSLPSQISRPGLRHDGQSIAGAFTPHVVEVGGVTQPSSTRPSQSLSIRSPHASPPAAGVQ